MKTIIRNMQWSLLLLAATTTQQAVAQPAKPNAPQPQMATSQPADPFAGLSFKKLNPELSFAFITDKPTTAKPQEGDMIKLNMQLVYENRLLYSTAQAFKGKPGEYGVAKPAFKGDIIEAIMFMTPGDSIVCRLNADVLFRDKKTKRPDFLKPGARVLYLIKLVSIKPKEQVQKEQQALFQKQMKEQMAKQQAEAAKQMMKDDKALQDYFKKNNLKPIKTASGLYYTIDQEGTGEKPQVGDNVTMNYTGTLLDGTKFDSNEDTAFKHVSPFQFPLGRGAVIKGWDEGVALLKAGTKATFYIPSPMAYGPQARPGGGANPKGIPANSILIFKVQLLSFTHPEPPAKKDTAAAPAVPQMQPVKSAPDSLKIQSETIKEAADTLKAASPK